MSKTKERLLRQASESAAKNLANHTIEQLHRDGDPGRIWVCSNEGRSIYRFTVLAPPGWLIIHGDMGEYMWARHRDMLPFVRGSVHDLHYFSEKCSRNVQIREFYPSLAEEWLSEQPSRIASYQGSPITEEQQEALDAIGAAWDEISSQESLQLAAYNSGLYDSTSYLPHCEYFTAQYLWTIEALKWFIAKLDAGEFSKAEFTW